jgi:hypothetical protein
LPSTFDEGFEIGRRIPNTATDEDVREPSGLPFLAERAGADAEPLSRCGLGEKGKGFRHLPLL